MSLNKEQFEQCLDDLLRSFAAYEHEQGLPPAPDGRHHININHTNYIALLTARRWAMQNVADFEPKSYCVMCGTPLSTTDNDNALCDYHLRLKTSGLACIWGYEDSDGNSTALNVSSRTAIASTTMPACKRLQRTHTTSQSRHSNRCEPRLTKATLNPISLQL
jgi:hypothetical protein